MGTSTLAVADQTLLALGIAGGSGRRVLPVVPGFERIFIKHIKKFKSFLSKNPLVVKLKKLLIVGQLIEQIVPITGPQGLHVVGSSGRVQLIPNGIAIQVGLLEIHYPGLVVNDQSRGGVMIPIHIVDPIAGIQIVVRRH